MENAHRQPAVFNEGRRDGLLEILWRRKWAIIGSTLVFIAGAVAYLLVARPTYRAQCSLYVRLTGPNIVNSDQPGGVQPSAVKTNLYTQREVLRSTEILSLKAPEFRRLETFARADDVVQKLKDKLVVDIGDKDELVTISYETPVREDAPVIVNGIVDAYRRFHSEEGQHVADKLQTILMGQRQTTQKDLDEKSQQMVAFKRSHGVLDYDGEKSDVNRERLSSLLKALTDATSDRINAQLAYNEAAKAVADDPQKMVAVEEMKNRGGMKIISKEDADLLRTEMFQWQARLQDTEQQYLAEHPRVRSMRRRVEQLSIAYVAAAGSRLEAAQQRERDLQGTYDEQNKRAIDRSADATEYGRMKSEVDRLEKLLSTIESEITKINLAQAAESALKINVLEPATIPDARYRPQWKTTLAIAAAVGLMVGILLAALRDWSDPRLHSMDDIRASLGLPVLGAVPLMSDALAPAVRGQQILIEPAGEVAEAYRSLRTSIKFGTPAGHSKTMVITSPNSGDGKTTLASNLAIALAQVGKRVLVVDADLRRPGQHEIFGAENSVGLADVLERDAAPEAAVQKTTIDGLEIMPAGPMPENPSEILNGQKFIDLLDSLADRYDHVVIDSPPTLPVTDARIIAASCDVTIMAIRADQSDRRLCQLARSGLLGVGANLIGVVINRVRGGNASYGYVADRPYLAAAPALPAGESSAKPPSNEAADIGGSRPPPFNRSGRA